MNIPIQMTSTKCYKNINDIVIQDRFKKSMPSLEKILEHHQDYLSTGYLDPIIVSSEDVLIDGYISYLIHKNYGHGKVQVYRIKVKTI